jgi:hypothetical protein
MLHFRQKITLYILTVLGIISVAMTTVSLAALFVSLYWPASGDVTIFSNLVFSVFTFWAGVIGKIAFDKKTAALDSSAPNTPIRFERTPEPEP